MCQWSGEEIESSRTCITFLVIGISPEKAIAVDHYLFVAFMHISCLVGTANVQLSTEIKKWDVWCMWRVCDKQDLKSLSPSNVKILHIYANFGVKVV